MLFIRSKTFLIFSVIFMLGITLLVGGKYAVAESEVLNNTQSTVNESPYQSTDWQLSNLQGEKIKLSDYQGQPVLLVFWATWCPYCKKLLPGIEALNKKYASKGLKIIGVNIREDWKPKVYWANHGYTFDAVLDGDEVAKIYGVNGTPGIVFIDREGKVLGVQSFSDPEHPLLEKFAAGYTK
jgi:thiol-disulfide isomerase/thioredoxin